MKKFFLAILLGSSFIAFCQNATSETDTAKVEELVNRLMKSDSINKTLKYETGLVKILDIATLNIPAGFKFLDAKQSRLVLEDIWGNPEDKTVLGMIFPEYGGPLSDSSYAFAITWDEMGYVKDDDAKDMDYAALLKDLQSDEKEMNAERIKMGYEPIHMVGWAQKPYYDGEKKVLHWAKELNFGESETNTLNYDVRVLGRKGVLSLNAIAAIDQLPLVAQDIPQVLAMAEFTEGNKYSDFNSSTDNIAAYTVGGLVAGKVLAKAGFFAMLLKGWKFILIGLIAVWGALKKFVFGKKETPSEELVSDGGSEDEIGKVNKES